MSVKRFQAGHLTGEATINAEKNYLEKPVMMVYAGKFKSMDGDVEIKDEDIDKLVNNHNGLLSKLKRLAGVDEVAIHHNPPLQVDHSTSAHDTVGRVVGDLSIGEHINEDGKKVKALMGRVRVLGKENMEKVQDGRWAQVSIGADLDNHKLSELSITPFPAAENASLLRKSEDENNPDLSGNSQGEKRMSYKETKEKADLYGKCRKHLTEHKKMSEEDADKHLESAKDEDLKKMAEEHDEHLKHLAAEDEKKKEEEEKGKAKMGAAKTSLIKLTKDFRAAGSKVLLAKKATDITLRLSKLRGEAKISPAEIKKINIDELAAKGDEAIEAALSSYAQRQPVIDTGVLGSTKAMSPSQLAAQLKKANLGHEELRTRLAMPSKRAEALKEMEAAGLKESDIQNDVRFSKDDSEREEHLGSDEAYEKCKKLMEDGKHDEAKEHLKSYMASASGKLSAEANPASDPTPRMSALAEQVQAMQNEFESLVKLAAPIVGATEEELK